MSILTDRLKESVEIDGRKYSINPDFKTALRVLATLDEDTPYVKKLVFILKSFYNELPPTLDKALEGIKSFYGVKEVNEGYFKPIFSFEKDSEYIFSAFYSCYKIDLSQENMHWDIFKALFKGISGDTVFSKIMSIRTLNPLEIKDTSQRRKIMDLQDKYSIKPKMSLEEGLRRFL